jgi:hypothetical protein
MAIIAVARRPSRTRRSHCAPARFLLQLRCRVRCNRQLARNPQTGLSAGVSPMENSQPPSDLATVNFPASTTDPTAPSIVPELPGVLYSESVIAVVAPSTSRTVRSPPRSVALRVTERFVLGVAALALYVAWIWVLPEAPRETPVLRPTTEPAEIVPDASTASIPARAPQQTPPPWFSPQLLYIPTWMPTPSPSPPAGVPLPMPRPSRQ